MLNLRNSFGRSVRDWEYKLSNVYQYYFVWHYLQVEKTRDERLVDVLENKVVVTTINVVSSNRGENINTMNPN